MRSEGLFGQSFSKLCLFRHLEGSLAWGPFLLFSASGTKKGPLAGGLLYRSARQALKGAAGVGSHSVVQYARRLMDQPLYCSAAGAGCVRRESQLRSLHPLHVTLQDRLAPMAARLSSTGIPSTISSLTSPPSISPQSTAALAPGLFHNS